MRRGSLHVFRNGNAVRMQVVDWDDDIYGCACAQVLTSPLV